MKSKARLSTQAKLAKNVQYESPITLYGTAIVKKDCSIGAYTFINSNTTLYPGTKIGRYCSIGKNCEVAAFDHPVNWLSTSPFQYNMKLHFPKYENECHQIKIERPEVTTIGNDVWIGASCIIRRGVTIGNGAIIGGGCIVTKDIPPYAIVGGVPGKILKYRFNEKTIATLLSLKWWELNATELGGVKFNDIDKAIAQIKVLRNVSTNKSKNTTKKDINALQKAISERMEKSQKSEPLMTFEALEEIISSQLLDADITESTVQDIMTENKNMYRDYDTDEHTDQIILNHKIATTIEIVFADKCYTEKKILSKQGHKKIKNVLRDKQ